MREDDGMRGRWTTKEMGSVVIAADTTGDAEEQDAANGDSGGAGIKFRNTEEAERTLADAKFVIGDFVDCAVFPPLADGSIAPGGPRGSYAGGPGSRGMGTSGPPPPRENGYGRSRGGGYGLGRGDAFGGGGRGGDFSGGRVPPGEWRRGERLPESGYGRGFGGGRGRGRGGY
jgi:histone deacetylase complex subunit SAP18